MLKVINGGIHASIQDTGRWGFQQYGMVVGGAMDQHALAVGNALVGNGVHEAALEITFGMTAVRFESDRLIAVTGADASPLLGGAAMPLWRPVIVRAGEELQFLGTRQGVRSYLAIAGGFDVPIILNSKSTYVKGKIGGFGGRALQKGDQVPLSPMNAQQQAIFDKLQKKGKPVDWSVNFGDFERFQQRTSIRVLKTRHTPLFDSGSLSLFESQVYTASNQCDRMGCHLQGEQPLSLKEPADLLSEAIAFGTIQVPPSGKPMILLADRQTTGGYPKIGQVISADFSALAQLKPLDEISFSFVSMQEAEQAMLKQRAALEEIRQSIQYRLHTT